MISGSRIFFLFILIGNINSNVTKKIEAKCKIISIQVPFKEPNQVKIKPNQVKKSNKIKGIYSSILVS